MKGLAIVERLGVELVIDRECATWRPLGESNFMSWCAGGLRGLNLAGRQPRWFTKELAKAWCFRHAHMRAPSLLCKGIVRCGVVNVDRRNKALQ